ncbi:DUF7281 domain-containing protein [Paraferrimonas sedimenticola]|uniref:DUF7281 domain-containing protein n=1 Tax=Paraferrimonas sedimenticola TaxID=375674 RepID=A0AA37RUD6_9GAMM|nr:hypothetical protein [Paraferrimonas sedimenticola]GLP95361.1 hypothetical protein GCM10007895_06670 [Paraferrimonas sedimenticola]
MALTKQLIKALSNFQQKPTKLSLPIQQRLSQYLIEEYPDLVRVRGQQLVFTTAEKHRLFATLAKLEGYQPLLADAQPTTRIQQVAITADEKQADLSPNQTKVLLKTLGRALTEAGLSEKAKEGVTHRIDLGSLDFAQIQQVVMVENLEAFDAIEAKQLPSTLGDAIILYKGDGFWAGTKRFLAMLHQDTQVVGYYDADPSGLCMALDTPRLNAILWPACLDELQAYSKQAAYDKQATARQRLSRIANSAWQSAVDQVLTQRLAITQEAMLMHGSQLILLPKAFE